MSSPLGAAVLVQMSHFSPASGSFPLRNAARLQHSARGFLHGNADIKKKSLMSLRFSFLCQQGTWRAQLFVGSAVARGALKRLISVWRQC